MLKIQVFRITVLLSLLSCAFVTKAAFVSQTDSIETGNFLLLTPLTSSLSDNLGLRTKEHLIINENERVKYQLKNESGTKRGKIIRIMDSEIQFYNQITGKVEYVAIDNIKSIRRAYGWKGWAGLFTAYSGLSLFFAGIILALFALFFSLTIGNIVGASLSDLLLSLFYSIFALLSGTALTYASLNILYKYKKFRIGKKYNIEAYSIKKLNK